MSTELYTAENHIFSNPNGSDIFIGPQTGQNLYIDASITGSSTFPDISTKKVLFKDAEMVAGCDSVFYEKSDGSLFVDTLKAGTSASVKNSIQMNSLPINYNSVGTGTGNGYHSFRVNNFQRMIVEDTAVSSLVTHKVVPGSIANPGLELTGYAGGKTGLCNLNATMGFTVQGSLAMQCQSLSATNANTASVCVGETANLNGGIALFAVPDYLNRQNIALAASTGNTKTMIAFFNQSTGTNFGSIVCNSATSVSYTTTSDARLKQDIRDLPNCLKTVLQASPKTFKWISSGQDDVGFIAQQLKVVVPNAVHAPPDNDDGTPGFMSVDPSKLIPYLVGAVHELNSVVESQKQELVQLNTDVDDLFARLEAMEKKGVTARG
jgi:hypothetical protein